MTQSPVEQEKEFKVRARRRIIGAVVLAVALAVLLPMVLESRPRREPSDVALTIPSPDKAPPFDPPLAGRPPAPEPRPLDVKPPPPAAPANDVAKPAPAEVRPLTSRPESEAPKPAAAAPEKLEKPEKPATGKFAVQLAVLSNPDNARALQERLKAAQVKFYVEKVSTPSDAVRVRVGPFTSRADAESAAARLKLAGFDQRMVIVAE